MQYDLEKRSKLLNNLRKVTIGTKDRSYKIRSYNFQHQTVIDHRIKESFAINLHSVLEGTTMLNNLITELHKQSELESIQIGLNHILSN